MGLLAEWRLGDVEIRCFHCSFASSKESSRSDGVCFHLLWYDILMDIDDLDVVVRSEKSVVEVAWCTLITCHAKASICGDDDY